MNMLGRQSPVLVTCALLTALWLVWALVDSLGPHRIVGEGGALVPMQRRDVLWLELATYLRWLPFSLLAVVATNRFARWRLPVHLVWQPLLAAVCIAGFSAFSAASTHTLHLGLADAIDRRGAQALTLYLTSLGVYFAVSASLQAHRHAVAARALEAQLAQARLDALRAQLHPHFLFNTLHTIATLIETGPDDARRMVTGLGELLRMTLERSTAATVTVREELAWIERYLTLQRFRFGEKLDVEISTEPAALSARIPTLLLQPLVENAFVHGANPETGELSLRIAVTVSNARVTLLVSDAGPGLSAERSASLHDVSSTGGSSTGGSSTGASSPRAGIGLRNTRERLQVAYGALATMDVGTRSPHGTSVAITLPLQIAADRAALGTSQPVPVPPRALLHA